MTTPDNAPFFPPGHLAGDFADAPNWEVLTEEPGVLRVRVRLPDRARNPRGQLFGGFAGTYVDLVAIATVYAGSTEPRSWLATTNIRIDYLAPVTGPEFEIEGRLVAARGRTRVVDVNFFVDGDDHPALLAHATMRVMPDGGQLSRR
ncbi:MAG: PaaI family thioesterase [Acidimicrobiia bacterium]